MRAGVLDDFYRADSRLVLVPIEHLTPTGVTPHFAPALVERAGWTAAHIALFDAGFTSYWARAADLARRVRGWAPPRLRHVAVVRDPRAVQPYASLLNTSAWTLYECDLDPASSHAELVAYLLVHGDRVATLGEVTMAALHDAAYWFERGDGECAAFAAAAARSTRPDAAAFQALAGALPWLRELRHDLHPPAPGSAVRSIPGTGVQVPRAFEAEPPALVERWQAVATRAVDAYTATWRASDPAAATALVDWLAASAPPLLIGARDGHIVWDPETPSRLGPLRAELKRTSGAAVRDIAADLQVVANHTRRFLAALTDPAALPQSAPQAEQRGYTYMHRARRLLAYNLDEPGIDRRRGPALPFARAMLGARAVHEWAHLAVDAGWVPCAQSKAERAAQQGALAQELDGVLRAAPAPLREQAAADLARLVEAERAIGDAAIDSAGVALVRVLFRRMPDYQANLLGARFLTPVEQETYVRHNVRTLRPEYPPARLWRMLVRYLYEYQYLRFSAVPDPRAYFLLSTWFEADFLASGVLDGASFDRLTAAVAAQCDGYAIDEHRVRPVP